MNNSIKKLAALADKCDELGFISEANEIDFIISKLSQAVPTKDPNVHVDGAGITWTKIGPTPANPKIISWKDQEGKVVNFYAGKLPGATLRPSTEKIEEKPVTPASETKTETQPAAPANESVFNRLYNAISGT